MVAELLYFVVALHCHDKFRVTKPAVVVKLIRRLARSLIQSPIAMDSKCVSGSATFVQPPSLMLNLFTFHLTQNQPRSVGGGTTGAGPLC